MSSIVYSLIAPTFGRPEEVTEFIESLIHQDYQGFEVIIADGTPGDTLRPVLKQFEGRTPFDLRIIYEEYLPVSAARNEGAKIARGEVIVFFDSDCIIPSNYLKVLDKARAETGFQVFGGPDAAHADFTNLQKAISYSMTAMLTTGGIRGKANHVGEYHPRGFNMGMDKSAFEAVGGYSTFRCGEDIELSIRLIKSGFKTGLIPEAFVYHKRRTTIKQFFKQVFRFGAARINLWKRHPEQLKLTHLFPFAFATYFILSVLFLLFSIVYKPLAFAALPMLVYLFAVFLDSSVQNKSITIGWLSVQTTIVMQLGYGWGFLKNFWAYHILKMPNGLKL